MIKCMRWKVVWAVKTGKSSKVLPYCLVMTRGSFACTRLFWLLAQAPSLGYFWFGEDDAARKANWPLYTLFLRGNPFNDMTSLQTHERVIPIAILRTKTHKTMTRSLEAFQYLQGIRWYISPTKCGHSAEPIASPFAFIMTYLDQIAVFSILCLKAQICWSDDAIRIHTRVRQQTH